MAKKTLVETEGGLLKRPGKLLFAACKASARWAIGKSGSLLVLSLCVIAGGISFADYARGLPIYKIYPSSLEIMNQPAWMTRSIEKEILNPPGMPKKISIFEPDLANKLATLYQRYPWVSKVLEVRKQYPNQLFVRFELRRPVARVAVGSVYYYVDQYGARLSEHYYDLSEDIKMPLIIGASKPVPMPGQEWPGGAVQAGIELLDIIKADEELLHLGLNVVDVSNVNEERDERDTAISMILNFGNADELQIDWGRSSKFAKHGELSNETKIDNLKLLLLRFPGLQGIKRVKLQFADPYWAVR